MHHCVTQDNVSIDVKSIIKSTIIVEVVVFHYLDFFHNIHTLFDTYNQPRRKCAIAIYSMRDDSCLNKVYIKNAIETKTCSCDRDLLSLKYQI